MIASLSGGAFTELQGAFPQRWRRAQRQDFLAQCLYVAIRPRRVPRSATIEPHFFKLKERSFNVSPPIFDGNCSGGRFSIVNKWVNWFIRALRWTGTADALSSVNRN